MVKGFLGEYRRVNADDRTKPLVVTDISENIEAMKKLFGMTNSYSVLFLKPFPQVPAF
jgi:type II secretory pathway component HofQ